MAADSLQQSGQTEATQAPDRLVSAVIALAEKARRRGGLKPAEAAPGETRQMFLPGLEEFTRAQPNQIARSSLYAPLARGRRRPFHRDALLVSRSDAIMSYTGEQLDEADADLCMQLLQAAQGQALGTPVRCNRGELLRRMDRHTGKSDYLWLHRRMKALTAGTLVVEAVRQDGSRKYEIGRTRAFHILQNFDYDPDQECYTYLLDPRWAVLYGNREYALIDWQKRLALGNDMAKSLQRLFATSSDRVQRYALDWLRAKLCYTSPMNKFRRALMAAIAALQTHDVIKAGDISTSTRGVEQLVVTVVQRTDR